MKISSGQIFFEPNELAGLDPVSITALATYGKAQNQTYEEVVAVLINGQISTVTKEYLASSQSKDLLETFAALPDADKATALQSVKDLAAKK